MEKEKTPTVLESPDIVAFIISVSKKHVRPFLRLDGKVVFEFDEDISSEIEAFYSNEIISNYCKNLKMVRSMIFTLKAGGRR